MLCQKCRRTREDLRQSVAADPDIDPGNRDRRNRDLISVRGASAQPKVKSRLLFLTEFLEARIIPERIEHRIEPVQMTPWVPIPYIPVSR